MQKPDSRLAEAWAEPDEESLDDEYQVRNDRNRESFDSLENSGYFLDPSFYFSNYFPCSSGIKSVVISVWVPLESKQQ